MNENFLNVGNSNNIMNDQKKEINLKNFNSIDEFAKKLRMEKYDMNELRRIKNEAILNESKRTKKKKATLKIQALVKGFLFRKKFKIFMEHLNKKIIFEYFSNKRKEKIKNNYLVIIQRCLNRYISNRRNKRRELLMRYYNFCSEQITRSLRGFFTRKKYNFILYTIRKSKIILTKYIFSFRIRLILRVKKLQNYLNDISHMKYLLLNLHSESRISEKSEKLKFELLDKIPKATNNFFLEFYKLKNKNQWVKLPRVKEHWMKEYFEGLKLNSLDFNHVEISKVFMEKNIRNKFDKKKIYKDTIDINGLDELSEEINLKKNNQNFCKSENFKILKKDKRNLENDIQIEKNPFITREEFYSNYFSEKNVVESNLQIENLHKNYSSNRNILTDLNLNNNLSDPPINHNRLKKNSNLNINEIQHTRKVSNLINLNNEESINNPSEIQGIFIQNIENEENNENIEINLQKSNFSSENFYQLSNANIKNQKLNNSNINYYSNTQININYNLTTQYNNPHDEKPIRANPNIFNEFLIEKEIQSTHEILQTDEVLENKTKISSIRRKTPKYDARKAIQEAKSKDKNNLAKKIHRENLKSPSRIEKQKFEDENIKNRKIINNLKFSDKNEESAATIGKLKLQNGEEKVQSNKEKFFGGKIEKPSKKPIRSGEINTLQHEKTSNDRQVTESTKYKLQFDLNVIDNKDNEDFLQMDGNSKDEIKNTSKDTRKRKIELNTNRKKLIEMEKSPHIKVDVKNVKSKIDCWGNSKGNNENKNLRRDDDANQEIHYERPKERIKHNILDDNSKDFLYSYYGSSKRDNMNNLIQLKKKQLFDKNYLLEIENQFNNINNFSNLHNFLGIRNDELKTRKIPYIKENSFYIKHYSDDIYEQLLMYLKKHYEELKN